MVTVIFVGMLAMAQVELEGPAPLSESSLKQVLDRLSHGSGGERKEAMQILESRVSPLATFTSEYPTRVVTMRRAEFQRIVTPLVSQILPLLKSKDDALVSQIITVLAVAGREAGAAESELRRILLDPKQSRSLREHAFWALPFILPEDRAFIPIAKEALNSLPRQVVQEFLKDFVLDEADGRKTAPAASATYHPISGDLFVIAMDPMVAAGHTKVEVTPLIKIATENNLPIVRGIAIGALAGLSFDAKSAVPELRKLLKDKELIVRSCAADALVQITQDRKMVAELVQTLHLTGTDRSAFEERAAAYFRRFDANVMMLREESRTAGGFERFGKVYEPMLNCSNGYFRRYAIRQLGLIGAPAKSSLAELRKATRDRDPDTRQMAADAIRQIELSEGRRSD